MRNKLIQLYIFLLHILLLIFIFNSDAIKSKLNLFGLNLKSFEITSHHKRMVEYHNQISKNIIEGTTIFIGNSHVQGLATSRVKFPSENFGIGGDTTYTLIERLKKYDTNILTGKVVLAIGINDLKYRQNDEIINNFTIIFEHLKKSRQLLVTCIFPVNEKMNPQFKNHNNRIRNLNKRIKKLSKEVYDFDFIDICSSLEDRNGNLSAKYDLGDGLHLTESAKRIWLNEISNIIRNN